MKLLSGVFLILAPLLAICNITAALPAPAIQPAQPGQAVQPIDCSNVLSTGGLPSGVQINGGLPNGGLPSGGLPSGGLPSGVENIYPSGSTSAVQVFCEKLPTETDRYTVILKRTGSMEFNKNFTVYENGFGDPAAEYFIGLKNLHLLTRSRNYELLVRLVDINDVMMTARYSTFSVGAKVNNYPLTLSGFTGGVADILAGRDGQTFSTSDQDNSPNSCAQITQTGFWYSSCQSGNSDGFFVTDAQNYHHQIGVKRQNSGLNPQLKSFTMMIHPK